MLLHPAMVQMIGLFVGICAVTVLAFFAIRTLRRDLVGGEEVQSPVRTDTASFALAACQSVIAGLKSREQELLTCVAHEKGRFTALEVSSNLILENIETGVMTISPNLLVQQANRAARILLGFASPLNMHVKDVFRGLQTVELPSTNGALTGISQAIRDVVSRGAQYHDVTANYCTPGGDKRQFRLELLPTPEAANSARGALCFIVMAGPAPPLSAIQCATGPGSAQAD
jgi:hypothetical protein